MPFNGAGSFSTVYSWQTDKINGIKVRADRMDGQDSDFATGLSTCITKDGQQVLTANIPFGGFKPTGVGLGSSRTDLLRVSQQQDNDLLRYTTGGAADAYTITPAPFSATYVDGEEWIIKIHTVNLTTTPTLNRSGIGAKTIVNADGSAVAASDLATSGEYRVRYQSSGDKFFLPNMRARASALALTDGGLKTANFSASANTKYRMKGLASAIVATLPTGGTAGDVIILAAYGSYGGQMCGTINGIAQTLPFDQSTLPITYTQTSGWV